MLQIVLPTTVHNYTIDGLATSSFYDIQLLANNSDGTSLPSPTVTALTRYAFGESAKLQIIFPLCWCFCFEACMTVTATLMGCWLTSASTFNIVWIMTQTANTCLDPIYCVNIVTGRNEVVAKVIFLHLSVIHSVHRGGVCLSACWDTSPPPPSRKQTPAYGLRAAGTHPTGMHSC